MKDTILICVVTAAFILGYFLMDKVDKFIEINHRPVSELSEEPARYIAFEAPEQTASVSNLPEDFSKGKENCELHLFSEHLCRSTQSDHSSVS